MHKLYVFALVFTTLAVSLLVSSPSFASSPNVLISQIQLGNASSASNEFIEIYNNSESSVDITNWCLYYASASTPPPETLNWNKLTCFLTDSDLVHLYLPGHSSVFIISNQYALSTPSLGSDFKFSATLSGSAGYVHLTDGAKNEVDKVGWGASAVSAEGGSPATVPTSGKILVRKLVAGANILQDTDINKDDFEVTLLSANYLYGLVYEVQDICGNIDGIQTNLPDGYSVDIVGFCSPPPVDVCSNLDGLQIVIPDGYGLDETGNCQVDVCQNIDGLQQIMPDGMELDSMGNCVLHDECLNLTDIQVKIPIGYKKSSDGSCMLDLLPLNISELLPNASGSDDGNEFIEIYNPNEIEIDLENYILYVNSSSSHSFSLPDGLHISPKSYLAFSNDDVKYTLVNTTGSVQLKSADGQVIDETPIYSDPKDDTTWALIDGLWSYTNVPTPGSANKPSLVLVPVVKTISTASTLVPCKDGQYRSEETNRCRNIATDVVSLVPCAEGQERNPDTNRCRSIVAVLGANTLTPCKEGQERNPDTNRCRNIISTTVPVADYAPEKTAGSSNGYLGWVALAGVLAVAILYGLWEWRHEIGKIVRKMGSFLHFGK